jgi:hypothetical protein
MPAITTTRSRTSSPTFVANPHSKNLSASYSDSDLDSDEAGVVTSTSLSNPSSSNPSSSNPSSSSSDSSGIYGNETMSVLDHHTNYLLSQIQDKGSNNTNAYINNNNNKDEKQRKRRRRKRMCRYYLPSGCHLGSNCFYSHSHSHSHSHNQCSHNEETKTVTTATTTATTTTTTTTNLLSDSKNMKKILKSAPCPNYYRGTCQYEDDHCRFGHFDFDFDSDFDSDSDTDTTSNNTTHNSTTKEEKKTNDEKKKKKKEMAALVTAADVVFSLVPLRWGVISATTIELPAGIEFWLNDLIRIGKNKYELQFLKIRPSEHRIPPEHSIIDDDITNTNRNSIDIPPPSDSNSSGSNGGVKVIKVKGGHWGEYTSRDGTTFLKICGWEDIVSKFSIKMKEFLLLLVTQQAQTQTQTQTQAQAQKQQKENDDKTTSTTTLSSSSTSGVSLPKRIDEITGLPFDIDTLGRQCGFWQLIVRHQQQQQKQQQQQQQQENHENNTNKNNIDDNRNKMKNIKLNLQRRSKQCGNRIRLDFIIDSNSDGVDVNAKDNAYDNVDAKANANANSESMMINLRRVKVARQNYRNAIITAKKITKELDLFLSL